MKILKRFRRRRALRGIRIVMIAMGRDPGDLLQPRNYRRLLRSIYYVRTAYNRFGASPTTAAAAMTEFGKAWSIILPEVTNHG